MNAEKPKPAVKPRQGLPPLRRLTITGVSAALTLAALVLVVLAASVWLFEGPGPAAPHGAATVVVLRQGAGLSEIGSTLRAGGVIRSPAVFMAAAQVTGFARHLKAGEYEFPSHASLADILAKIRRGEIVRHMITIPEGLTSEEAVDILMNANFLTGAAPVPAEGAILPETYDVRRGEDRGAVLQRMIDARDALLGGLWAQRAPDLPLETPEQAMILASIIEKETGVPDERPRIAAVMINRLRQHIRLQSDPTIIYGLTRGMPLGRGIRQSEITGYTPYNTYLIDGLPPTPICNPGRASIAAALDPAHTDDLYFVADGTGGHAFSATLEAHLKNVARWRAIEQKAQPLAGTTH